MGVAKPSVEGVFQVYSWDGLLSVIRSRGGVRYLGISNVLTLVYGETCPLYRAWVTAVEDSRSIGTCWQFIIFFEE